MAAQTSLRDTERLVWNTSSRSDALGQHALWGFSPARDLLDPPPAAGGGATVLLASPGDVRHVLKTIAARRLRGGAKETVTFLVHESSVELVARHLLLLRVAFDWELPLRQRAAVWLELFGNALVQERTETYVSRLAAELLDLASGGDACDRAAKESGIPNFKGSFLGRFPLVLADFWTSDRLSERSRSVDAFCGTRARGTLTLKRH